MLFLVIFILTYINSVRQIQTANPIELLHSDSMGEREPKSRFLLAFFGILSLGSGYFLAITTKNPVSSLTLFFLAVILVIIGTYLLFTAGSVVFLKMLRRNKHYYYQVQHFTSVSGHALPHETERCRPRKYLYSLHDGPRHDFFHEFSDVRCERNDRYTLSS